MVYAVKHISFLIMGPVGFTRLKFRIYCANKFVSSLCANIGHFPAMTKPPRMCPADVKKIGRSRWPSGLRRRSTAAWLLGSRVWIPLLSWMCRFLCLFCVVYVAASTTGWSLVERSSTVCVCVCVCVCVWSRNLKAEADCCATERQTGGVARSAFRLYIILARTSQPRWG